MYIAYVYIVHCVALACVYTFKAKPQTYGAAQSPPNLHNKNDTVVLIVRRNIH